MEDARGPRVADSSCLFALFKADDEHHAAARKEVERPGPLVIPSEVLVETLGLIGARLGRPAAKAAAAFLGSLPHVEFTHPTDLHEALLIQREHPELSVVDAAVVWHCRRLPARAATFDKRLERLAKR